MSRVFYVLPFILLMSFSASADPLTAYTLEDAGKFSTNGQTFTVAGEQEWLDHDPRILNLRQQAKKDHATLIQESVEYRQAVDISLSNRQLVEKVNLDIDRSKSNFADTKQKMQADYQQMDKSITNEQTHNAKSIAAFRQRMESSTKLTFAEDEWAFAMHSICPSERIDWPAVITAWSKFRKVAEPYYAYHNAQGALAHAGYRLLPSTVDYEFRLTDKAHAAPFATCIENGTHDAKLLAELYRQMDKFHEIIRPAYERYIATHNKEVVSKFMGSQTN